MCVAPNISKIGNTTWYNDLAHTHSYQTWEQLIQYWVLRSILYPLENTQYKAGIHSHTWIYTSCTSSYLGMHILFSFHTWDLQLNDQLLCGSKFGKPATTLSQYVYLKLGFQYIFISLNMGVLFNRHWFEIISQWE